MCLTKEFWLSSNKMTVCVTTNTTFTITDGPNIIKKFIGQQLPDLVKWMKEQGGFQWKKM